MMFLRFLRRKSLTRGSPNNEFSMKEINENSTKEEVIEVVKQSGVMLKFASEELHNDKDVVMAVVRQHGGAFEYIWYALDYASEGLVVDRMETQGENNND